MAQSRSMRFGTAVVVVVALVVALVATVPSFAGPQSASAQTVCNGAYTSGYSCVATSGVYCGGTYYGGEATCPTTAATSCTAVVYPNSEVCTENAGVSCGGTFYANQTYCPESAGISCNGAYYPGQAVCSENAGTYCNGAYYAGMESCPLTTGVYCNGSYYASTTACPLTTGTYCNGSYYADTSTCPLTAGVYCNGSYYADTANCPITTGVSCNGVYYTDTSTCPLTTGVYCNGSYYAETSNCPSVYVSPAPTVTTAYTPLQSGYPVTFAAGWNIVGGPTGATITGNTGPLYAFRAGDPTYEVLAPGTPVTSGVGYWAYFPTGAADSLPLTNGGTLTVSLPVGQFVMIGNLGDSTATVTGADVLLTFNTATNSYAQTTQLAPGQGAWALSFTGSQAAITNLPGFTTGFGG